MVGIADFDGNGSSDVLFRHVPTGTLFVWWMDGLVQTGGGYLTPSVVPTNWVLVATDDFNGDHKSDIVWQEASTGAIYIWYMNGATQTGGTYATPGQVDPLWRITGAADLNNDGHTDLVFRHIGGWVAVWFMNGATLIGGGNVTSSPLDPNWQIVAFADFDHDGDPDALFYSVSTQSLYILYLDGIVQQGFSQPILSSSIAPPNWKVVGAR